MSPELLAKLRLLVVRERELATLRQVHEQHLRWIQAGQQLMAQLARTSSLGEAIGTLVTSLVAEFRYDMAGALSPPSLSGDPVHALTTVDRHFIDQVLTQAKHTGDLVVSEGTEIDGPRTLAWLMAGSAGTSDMEEQPVIVVGRTRRTAAYYPVPKSEESGSYRHLLSTVAQVFRSVSLQASHKSELERKVEERTAELFSRNRDMRLLLDNVEQGFLTLDARGRVSEERSLVVDRWFGAIQGRVGFGEYIRRADPEVADSFEVNWSAIEDGFLPLELCLFQLPKLMKYRDGTLELAYRPILRDGQLDKVLVVITDVTARIKRERAEEIQRDTMCIFRHLLSDRAPFEEFFREGRTLVASVTGAVSPSLADLKRHLHTLKGNCAIYGIESVARFCHDLEDGLDTGEHELSPAQKTKLIDLWENVEGVRAEFSREGAISLDWNDYDSFLADLLNEVEYPLLAAKFAALRFEPAGSRLRIIAEQVRQLALRLGKGDVRIQVESITLRLPPHKWTEFWSVFTHVVRNAVDHGLEAPAEREAAGKCIPATVALWIAHEDNVVLIGIRDDGRGIDWQAVGQRARLRGLPHATEADLEEALFAEGVSTRTEVTSTSGRGIGLSAVRATVKRLGGRIELQSVRGAGTAFRFYLPDHLLLEDESRVTGPSPEGFPAGRRGTA